MISYAQNMEDLLLKRVFRGKKNGFYIDIGAHDPEELSMTNLFYSHFEWRGINIEPNPENFAKFISARSEDVNLNLAISSSQGRAILYSPKGSTPSGFSATVLASLTEENAREAGDKFNLAIEEHSVQTDTLEHICEQYCQGGKQIDFMSIDTEGHDLIVLKSGNFNIYRPTVLVVEVTEPNTGPFAANHPDDIYVGKPIDDFLGAWRYIPVYYNGLNKFYLAEEAAWLQPLFSIPVGVFDGVELPRLLKKIAELEARLG